MVDLKGKAVTAVLWGTGGSVFRVALQLIAQAVLARLLGPGEYGVFSIGSVVIAFSSFIADVGLAYGLIQKKDVSDEDIRFAFTWQLVLGLLVSGTLALAASQIAAFFKEPRASDVIRVMSLICLINAVGAPAASLLKRQLDFRTQQLGFLASYFLGFIVVGIPMALNGVGVWALVAGWGVQSVGLSVFLFLRVRHPVRLLLWYPHGAQQASYSGTVLVTNLLNWAIGNVDRVVVGRLLPTQAIGLYATVYNFIYVPAASVLSILQPVLFSTSARAAETSSGDGATHERLERALMAVVAAISLYLLPMFATAAVLSDSLVQTMYGPAWAEASTILRPLALAMPFFLLWGLCTPVLWAGGHPRGEFLSQWPIALAWGLVCVLLARWAGAEAVAWGVLMLFVTRSLTLLWMLSRKIGVRSSALWQAMSGGVKLSLLVTGAAGMAHVLLGARLSAPLHLMAVGSLAMLAFVGGLRGLSGLVHEELAALTQRVLERMPPRWAVRMSWLQGRRRQSS